MVLLLAYSNFQDRLILAVGLTPEMERPLPPVEGIAVIFDSADGGIIASPLLNAQQMASGSLSEENFWKLCYMDPADAFRSPTSPQASLPPQK